MHVFVIAAVVSYQLFTGDLQGYGNTVTSLNTISANAAGLNTISAKSLTTEPVKLNQIKK